MGPVIPKIIRNLLGNSKVTPNLNEIADSGLIKKANQYHRLLLELGRSYHWDRPFREKFEKLSTKVLSEDADFSVVFILTGIDKVGNLRRKFGALSADNIQYMNLCSREEYPAASVELINRLLRRKLPFEEAHYLYMLNRTADLEMISEWNTPYIKSLIRITEKYVEDKQMNKAFELALKRMFNALNWIANAPERHLRERINLLLGGTRSIPIVAGETWSDKALEDLQLKSNDVKAKWVPLLVHCEGSNSGNPSKKWLGSAEKFISEIGTASFSEVVQTWFPLVDKPRTKIIERWSQWQPNPNLMINDRNASILKGLVWCCSLFEDKDMARCLRDLAISTYKKVPGVGPRAVRVGNACIYSLGHMEGMNGLYQLAYLKVKIRFKTALKLIEKALAETAKRLDVPREELEEISVPGYGLTDVGLLEEPLGDFSARLQILDGNKTELKWIKQDSKTQKSVPASVKKDYSESLKELKATMKDIQKMVPAQKERIQNLYLQKKQWSYPVWKERYLDHPLVGTLARRLLWKFKNGETVIDGIYYNGSMIDIDGNKFDSMLEDTCKVELWHPIRHDVEYIKKWRKKLLDLQIKQPFKQAHREVYVLTDAERQTRVYSNRYAGHIVKQHQFNSLCGARGWHNVLKLLVDADFPPASITLPLWGLRAEFWTDGAGEEYGDDTNETGTFYYLATDQVRFFPLNAPQTHGHAYSRGQRSTVEPVPLEDIPALVFSEVMRDVDLFVGVASVGNDPEWADSGPEGHRTYWQSYSFGNLGQQAETRKQVLMDLVPRLAIAGQCSFDGRFLRVQGKIRAYKIHLGSGNILMEPNDSYLCIVRNRTKEMKDGTNKLFLPFEGDETLSVIISKALLLANDTKIKDSTIVSQIKRF